MMNGLLINVQATFFAIALQPPPATRTNVFTLFNLACAGLTANAREALQV
jgi:hypothetical protein